jgi:hemolysin III
MAHKIQTAQEELVNAITHGIGVLLAMVLIPLLLMKALHSSPLVLLSAFVFSFGFLMAYLSSTLYHAASKPKTKKALRVWDHISIFFLIGGTYAPIVCIYTNHHTAIVFLGIMWSLIVCGSLLKIFFTGKYDNVSTLIYLTLGWMILFIIKPLYTNMSFAIFAWILIGGLAYTFGVIFYKWEKLKFQHGIWHLFVLAGTLFQYVAIYKSISAE